MGLFGFINKATKAVGSITKPISRTVEKVADQIKKIPVVGQVFDYATIGINLQVHMANAVSDLAQGKRIDKTGLALLKNNLHEYQKLGKYTQSVVSFVPGVGTGVAGALGAGVALSEGKRLDKVVIEGIKGSIPGGPLAQSAFSIAEGAVSGKPIDQIAINALPIPPQAKTGLSAALEITKDLAKGKRLDKALMARADDALKLVGPELAKVINIGAAVGVAKTLQQNLEKQVSSPEVKEAFAKIGREIAKADKLISTARDLHKDSALPAFDMATALMNGKKVSPALLTSARSVLSPEQKKAFDSAAALHIGRKEITRKAGKIKILPDPMSQVAMATTYGLQGAAIHQKEGIIKNMISIPAGREGTAIAIKDIANERAEKDKGFWTKVKEWLGL